MDAIARQVERVGAVAVCDAVYEHIVFGVASDVPLLTRAGMASRSLKIGSAGKTFSLTGWKVGMVVGPAHLVQPVARAHQFLTFTTPPNLQAAVAYGLAKDDAYFAGLAAEMERRRDRLARGLSALGVTALPAAGAYFLNIDIRSLGWDGDNLSFCRFLVEKVGVAAIPLSAFYAERPVMHLARLCFAKQDHVLDGALDRLARW